MKKNVFSIICFLCLLAPNVLAMEKKNSFEGSREGSASLLEYIPGVRPFKKLVVCGLLFVVFFGKIRCGSAAKNSDTPDLFDVISPEQCNAIEECKLIKNLPEGRVHWYNQDGSISWYQPDGDAEWYEVLMQTQEEKELLEEDVDWEKEYNKERMSKFLKGCDDGSDHRIKTYERTRAQCRCDHFHHKNSEETSLCNNYCARNDFQKLRCGHDGLGCQQACSKICKIEAKLRLQKISDSDECREGRF